MIQDIPTPKDISFTQDKKNPKRKGTVIIEPCFPGYGETIGNSLRRVLLSSLPGAAAYAIKISSVDHEFSAIDFVKEDVIELILNIKRLRFNVHSDEPVELELDVKGAKTVTGADIKKVDNVEVANPEQIIATLTDRKAKLNMQIYVDQGRGYVPVEQRGDKKLEVGLIAVDSIYTPVQKVSFHVENIRVGQMTNFDKITMKIETDGTITPEEALKKSAKILVDHYTLLKGDLKEIEKEKDPIVLPKESDAQKDEKTIAEMKFSTRTFNALQKNNIKTVDQLSKKSGDELLELDGFGKTALKEVEEKLKKIGLNLLEKE